MIFGKSKQTADTPTARNAQQAGTAEAGARKTAPTAGPSILTADLILEGNLATNGELQIDGTVHGAVQASICIIEANGVVQGSVMAEEVFIRGRVLGPICGVRVTVVAGAHVEGDILNQSIAIENGAYVDGKIKRSEDPMGDWQRMWYGEEAEPQQLTYDDPEFANMENDVLEAAPTYGETVPSVDDPSPASSQTSSGDSKGADAVEGRMKGSQD